MATAYRSGDATVRDLAQQYGRSRDTVSLALKRAGIRFRYNVLTPQQITEAGQRYQAGDSLAVLGERYGVTADTVAKALREASVVIRPRPGS